MGGQGDPLTASRGQGGDGLAAEWDCGWWSGLHSRHCLVLQAQHEPPGRLGRWALTPLLPAASDLSFPSGSGTSRLPASSALQKLTADPCPFPTLGTILVSWAFLPCWFDASLEGGEAKGLVLRVVFGLCHRTGAEPKRHVPLLNTKVPGWRSSRGQSWTRAHGHPTVTPRCLPVQGKGSAGKPQRVTQCQGAAGGEGQVAGFLETDLQRVQVLEQRFSHLNQRGRFKSPCPDTPRPFNGNFWRRDPGI